MNKINKHIFTRLASLLCALALSAVIISCNGLVSADEIQTQNTKAQLFVTFGGTSRSATIRPSDVTENDISKIVLTAKKTDAAEEKTLATWQSSETATAASVMKADTSLEVEPGEYTF